MYRVWCRFVQVCACVPKKKRVDEMRMAVHGKREQGINVHWKTSGDTHKVQDGGKSKIKIENYKDLNS